MGAGMNRWREEILRELLGTSETERRFACAPRPASWASLGSRSHGEMRKLEAELPGTFEVTVDDKCARIRLRCVINEPEKMARAMEPEAWAEFDAGGGTCTQDAFWKIEESIRHAGAISKGYSQ